MTPSRRRPSPRKCVLHLCKMRWENPLSTCMILISYDDLCQKSVWHHKFGTRWAPTSYKWGYNSYKEGCHPRYPVIRPFIGVITLLITSRGPPCIHWNYPAMRSIILSHITQWHDHIVSGRLQQISKFGTPSFWVAFNVKINSGTMDKTRYVQWFCCTIDFNKGFQIPWRVCLVSS